MRKGRPSSIWLPEELKNRLELVAARKSSTVGRRISWAEVMRRVVGRYLEKLDEREKMNG